jgi:hypothetical protein
VGKAASTVVYVQNRSSHAALGDKTPEEAFTGEKPKVGHLRIFGCPVYIHVPKEKRMKMEPSEKKGTFVGYSETAKAYRIYVPGQRYIEVSKDVTFDEKEALRRSRESDPVADEDEHEAPTTEIPVPDSPPAEVQREEPDEHIDPTDPMDIVEPIERPLDAPLVKRRPTWLKETLQEAQKHSAPSGTFRERRRPQRYSGYVAQMTHIIDVEPSTYEEAARLQVWKDAMMEEYQSIMKNDVWEVVARPEGKSIVTSKWIFKIKHAADRCIEKYKAKFVARGFSQKEGIDYEETFAPVARYTSIRAVISLAAVLGWRLHQMDVKTAFLNGMIEHEVYIEQPEGFVVHGKESHVCILKKALYGLKQAPRTWHSRIDSYLKSLGFTKSDVDSNLYFKIVQNHSLILVLYVDDLFLTGEEHQIAQCKRELNSKFEMKDLGPMHYFLGLEVRQKQDEIFLSQGKYTVDVLRRFEMMDGKSMATPMVTNLKKLHDSASSSNLVDPTMYRQLIGCLMYLMHTRPDICFGMSTLSQFMSEMRQVHWVATKHVLRYLRGTIAYGIRYTSNGGVTLLGYIYSDWAGSAVDRKSTSRY